MVLNHPPFLFFIMIGCDDMMMCRCGKIASFVASIPGNVYSGARQLCESEPVCEYHAKKCVALGYRTIPI